MAWYYLFAQYSKSSAILISLLVHAVVIIFAFFFVSVTDLQKEEVDFEAKITPDIKMPEIVGVKGWVGACSGGFGNAASLGFSMPEMNLLNKNRGL